ncbi:hypothetical protein GCM10027514_22110 [Azotobacter armeniacus]
MFLLDFVKLSVLCRSNGTAGRLPERLACKIERDKKTEIPIVNTDTEAFIVAATAEEAVDRLAALHQRATSALRQALKRYLTERVELDAAQRSLFRYPSCV